MDHLVYCNGKSKVLEKILSGTKTMIIRGAADRKLPYGRVFEGETLYFIKNRGYGLIEGKATVKSVFNSEKITEDESKKLISENMSKLDLSELQVQRWVGKNYICLVEIEDVEKVEMHLKFKYQKTMEDWVIIENVSSVVENPNERYNSLKYK
ncbi:MULTISPECIES: hypothetical protein [Clostridium]|uniref:Uncharacterized protein n=1 Tax=Clostridium cibarium TaxID=2762247 RepID=A0ABR8PUS4_9CLOT|nr:MULTISPECIES: hypothetical protein [Clostridium]MBD7911911.1 hypothetical protein [Clostridium cibarium]